jgi:uncharacterized protein (TIGR03790 family)
MSVALAQSDAASFPDRGTVEIEATLGAGPAGRYVHYDLGSPQGLVHTRVLVNTEALSGGRVHVAGAQTDSDTPAWSIELSPSDPQVTAHLGEGTTLTGDLTAGVHWHCLEIKLDAAGGEAELWINGRSTATATGSFSQFTMRHLWLGAVAKEPAATGTLHLDEWRIADAYIGPVVVAPASAYANDPRRWLVLYNTNDPESGQWAQTYQTRRGVPYANLLGLSLSTSEVISDGQFADLVSAVSDYLTRHALSSQILGILSGYRVPGYVDVFGDGSRLVPVSTMLQRLESSLGAYENDDVIDALPQRPTDGTLGEDRLAARVDGPDLAAAISMLDRADNQIANGLGGGDEARLYFDPVGGAQYATVTSAWRAWVDSLDRMRTRLPIARTDDGQSFTDANFTSVDHDGFFWAFPVSAPDTSGVFASPAGRRALSLQLHPSNATATTVRQPGGLNWIQAPHQAGYAAAVASSAPFSADKLPLPRPLFEALRQGWTLGEAWHVASPWLRSVLYLVGDPLMTVALPRAGWDVYGPLSSVEQLDVDTPRYALRSLEQSVALPGAAQPGAGEISSYLVRRVDAQGRREASATPVRVAHVLGQAVAPPLSPVWPTATGWPVWLENDRMHLCLNWDRPLRDGQVASVELRSEVDGAGETTLLTPAVDPNRSFIAVEQPLPNVAARFRWRVVSAGGAVWTTPWSATVRPADHSMVPLAELRTNA